MFCLDTYALWEIQLGNKNYIEILLSDFVITDWTLCEFYKTVIREHNKRTADYWLKKLMPFVCKVNINTLISAVNFQEENKKSNLSLFDCVGYVFSIENNYKFVTGDKEFKDKKGVKFLK